MIKIHTAEGQTIRVDLKDEEQAKVWLDRLRSKSSQREITGISVVSECTARVRCKRCRKTATAVCSCGCPIDTVASVGTQYSLSRPDGFGEVEYSIERLEPISDSRIRGGERVACKVGDMRISLMVHAGQPSARVTLIKM